MDTEPAIYLAAKEIGLVLESTDHTMWVDQLAGKINELLVYDFNKLISLLYRMDISETKLKQLLKDNPAEDAGRLIASLVIERQLQKIQSRKEFTKKDDDIEEGERW